MIHIFSRLENIEDPRQQHKVKHSIKDIVGISLIATLGNANEWTDIEDFAVANEAILRRYFELPNGIPSHDTIARVFGIIDTKILQDLYLQWNEFLSKGEGEKLKKIFNIDGKTMRGSGNKNNSPLHVVSAWCEADGVSLGQKVVDEKSNEIIAIPELLQTLNIKGHTITIDAMGTQVKIAEQIIKQKGNYVLAVKGNQRNLYQEIVDYFNEDSFLKEIIKNNGYTKTIDKARGQIETREYYQTEEINWMSEKKRWKGMKTIGMVQNKIEKDGKVAVERRFFISSEKLDVDLFKKCCRGHWAIESMHWHLDVTFKEDSNQTIDKIANQNLNVLRKWALSILKTIEISDKPISLKRKRFRICMNPTSILSKIMEI